VIEANEGHVARVTLRRRTCHSLNRCVPVDADGHEGGRHAAGQRHARCHYDDTERRVAPAEAGLHRERAGKD
jgi:hypothetical protein